MWRRAFTLVAALCFSGCVQILGDDFEIGPVLDHTGGHGGSGAASAGAGGMADGGAGTGGATAPTLTVTLQGAGSGRVLSDPAGIDCPTTCAAEFPADASVTLSAEPMPDTAFLGWSDACTGGGPCTVAMDAAKTVGSRFELHGSRRWVTQIGNPGDDRILDMVVDAAGNVVVAGTVEVTAGSSDIYVAKLSNVDGSTIWEKIFPTVTSETGGTVTVDSEGNVYVGVWVSSFGTGDTIEGHAITGDLFGNVLVIRLASATGGVDWLQEWGGGSQDRPHGLAVLGDDLFVAGETSSTSAVFGGFTLPASTGDAFLARVNRNTGAVLNARFFEGNNDIFDIAVNGSDVLVVGEHRAATTIDTGVSLPTSDGMADGMVVAFDSTTLTARWARTFGDSDNDTAFGAAAFPGGGFVVTGSFQGSVLFATSGTSLASNGGSRDAFVVRYDAAGDHQWSFRYGGPNNDVGRAIDVLSTGEVFLAGEFSDTITFGTHTLTGLGPAADIFVTRMSSDAAPIHQWASKLGGDSADFCESMAVGSAGSPYVTGSFSGMTVIDGEPLTATLADSWVAGLVR